MNFKNNKIDISYPLELIEKRNSFPPNHVIPCSVLVDNKKIGGIFIVCPSQEIKYFKIVPLPPPEPPLKFRMLNDEETDWFDRNYKLSTKLISDQRGYKILTEYLCKEASSTDRIFKYYNQKKSNFFVREGGIQVALHKVSKFTLIHGVTQRHTVNGTNRSEIASK
jgi:hypothetical protein